MMWRSGATGRRFYASLRKFIRKKGFQRGFTAEQRRSLEQSRTLKRDMLANDLEDFTIDHIDPYSKGGLSRLETRH